MTGPGVVRRVAGRVRTQARERVRSAYYAVGRDLPGSDRVEARVRRWEAGRGDVPKPKEAWNEQYAAGGWDYLSGIGELSHYSVIVGYAQHLRPGGSVLDVGCGSGVLHDRLRAVGYAHYTGVDISDEAVAALRRHDWADAEFVVADADGFEPGRSYDVVVLNESLTYFPDPEATFRRCLAIAEDGIVIVSCHEQSARARGILRGLVARHDVLDETVVRQGPSSWRCVVFRG
ncbi:MAG: methyltransferase domain-containing protein [Nocardioidaceae bacterium]|nr:methyltransferase domain-containing protein [Nocardioidaceae bacterium]MCL2613021.1 methyltransferase domain-containing protein [Nocardioidaceae bacterium]